MPGLWLAADLVWSNCTVITFPVAGPPDMSTRVGIKSISLHPVMVLEIQLLLPKDWPCKLALNAALAKDGMSEAERIVMTAAIRVSFPNIVTSLTTLTPPWRVRLIAGTALRKVDARQPAKPQWRNNEQTQ